MFEIDGEGNPNDELYPFLGEPIAPIIEMLPALVIVTNEGNYIFFGNGIHVLDINQEYERLKLAIKIIKEMKLRKKDNSIDDKNKPHQNLLEGVLKQIPPLPQITLPFFNPGKNENVDSMAVEVDKINSKSEETIKDSSGSVGVVEQVNEMGLNTQKRE